MRQLRAARAAGVPVSGRVTGVNTGGLTVDVGGVRGFCPSSQIDSGFCADPSVYVGRTLEFVVTEVKDGRGGVVLSRKAVLRKAEEEGAKRLLATLKPGDELDGKVARLEAFGAFIDLGGVDGLCHVSEIRHERTGHPREALREGQEVKVKVLRLETGKDGRPRIALSIKAATPDPWVGVEERFLPGQRVNGTVARLADFGAFVTLAPGIDGLVHVSEAALTRIAHVKDVLAPGQSVEAVVLAVDPAKKRISLSVRAARVADLPPEERAAHETRLPREPREGGAPRGDREGGAPRGGREGGAPRGGREGGAPRGGREGGGPRGGRGPREGRERPTREDREWKQVMASKQVEPELTTMAIALRKAMEEAAKKEKQG
jgi:small subunit ribosomal protein S1